ncbi:MAG: hypothetical protein K6G69_07085 [Lachnospiraceae bacterium]|nr:hypothetical protein [Lachnospiraceae bacterium]
MSEQTINDYSENEDIKKNGFNRKLISVLGVLFVVLLVVIIFLTGGRKEGGRDRRIIDRYLENTEKDYSQEEMTEIVNAYKNLLEQQGEEYVDSFLTREQQDELTYMGMKVNVFVFRDYKNYGYLNADDSFMDVSDFDKIAGFDVNAATGADGFANIRAVDITIDGTTYTTADLTEEIASFFERFEAANASEKVTTIYGVDTVDVDDKTRLYITYMDVQYDDNHNVTALRVSGHLALKE